MDRWGLGRTFMPHDRAFKQRQEGAEGRKPCFGYLMSQAKVRKYKDASMFGAQLTKQSGSSWT